MLAIVNSLKVEKTEIIFSGAQNRILAMNRFDAWWSRRPSKTARRPSGLASPFLNHFNHLLLAKKNRPPVPLRSGGPGEFPL
jgi:hypothetical protein